MKCKLNSILDKSIIRVRGQVHDLKLNSCTIIVVKKNHVNLYIQNLDLVYPVMVLLHTWGEVHLLMCQYTQHTDLGVEEPLQHPHWVSIVYDFITPMMAEKLYKLSLKTRRLQYLWVRYKFQISNH
jgi:hypothetical protein